MSDATAPGVPASTDSSAPAVVTPTAKWLTTIKPLVDGLEMTADAVTTALVTNKVVGKPNDNGADALVKAVSDASYRKAFPDAADGNLALAINTIREMGKTKAEAAPQPPSVLPPGFAALAGASMRTSNNYSIREVPAGSSFLDLLNTVESLKVDDEISIRAAVEAYFEDGSTLRNVPGILSARLEETFRNKRMPMPKTMDLLGTLEDIETDRKYPELGKRAKRATKVRRERFFEDIRPLGKELARFHAVLSVWHDRYREDRREDFAGSLTNSIEFQPWSQIVEAAVPIVDCFNLAFSAYGGDVASALAHEATKIRPILQSPDLPEKLGFTSREEMLEGLGIKLGNATSRMVNDVVNYVVFVVTRVHMNNLPTNEEGIALVALCRLGDRLMPWLSGIGSDAGPNRGGTNTRAVDTTLNGDPTFRRGEWDDPRAGNGARQPRPGQRG